MIHVPQKIARESTSISRLFTLFSKIPCSTFDVHCAVCTAYCEPAGSIQKSLRIAPCHSEVKWTPLCWSNNFPSLLSCQVMKLDMAILHALRIYEQALVLFLLPNSPSACVRRSIYSLTSHGCAGPLLCKRSVCNAACPMKRPYNFLFTTCNGAWVRNHVFPIF